MTAPAAPAHPGMVTLTIEGREVVVPPGTSLLEAAKTAGVLVPHYCYHPSLPVAGVCRMCLVEVEKFPKLAPACATSVGEGQIVHVHSEKAREARKGVLEFLLINHPLDCPICDQAGECELQDYTFAEGRKDSRYMEPKRFNPMEDFGGDVLYVPNRCILCTRCVRFMDVMAHDPVLNVSERGDRAYIGSRARSDLTHPWAGNVVDFCPVGALLSKDFLNKARAWELDRTRLDLSGLLAGVQHDDRDPRRDVVVAASARRPDVANAAFHLRDRSLQLSLAQPPRPAGVPQVARGAMAAVTASWSAARSRRGGTACSGGVARSGACVTVAIERDAVLLSDLAARRRPTAVMTVQRGAEAPLPGVKDLALRAERAPNHTGAGLLGFTDVISPLAGLGANDVRDRRRRAPLQRRAARAARARGIVIGTVLTGRARELTRARPARSAPCAEEEGTFTNLRGRVQRFLQAKAPPAKVRTELPRGSANWPTAHGRRRFPALASDVFTTLAQPSAGLHRLSLPDASDCRPAGAVGARGDAPDGTTADDADHRRRRTAFADRSRSIKVLALLRRVTWRRVAMLTLAERKVSAWIQDRHGPNRAGPSGLLQPVADGVKNFMKEELSPGRLATASCSPWRQPSPSAPANGELGRDPVRVRRCRRRGRSWISMAIADLPVGLPLHARDLLARCLRHNARRLGRPTTSTHCWVGCDPARR
ncbi:MAG: NADH-quinone oxidoreductase subunit H [Gemmatimonadaceae bacterium]|nr:NADH-quinone oxidoreductase subunit H [Gemmatimonadaceae bacterium]